MTVHTQLNNQLVTVMLILIVMKTAAMHEDRVPHTSVSMRTNVPTSTTCRCFSDPQVKRLLRLLFYKSLSELK